MHHEEHVGETSAKIGSISVMVSGRLGCVHIHTLRAVELHHCLARNVREPWRQKQTLLTHTEFMWIVPHLVILILIKGIIHPNFLSSIHSPSCCSTLVWVPLFYWVTKQLLIPTDFHSMERKKHTMEANGDQHLLGYPHSSKMSFVFADERNWYRFGKTWGRLGFLG